MKNISSSSFSQLLRGYAPKIGFYIFLIFLISGCKKFVEIPAPTNQLVASTVYANNATAAAVLTGIYSNMESYVFNGASTTNGIGLYTGLSADELTNYALSSQGEQQYYLNALNNTSHPDFWTEPYSFIYECNAAIEGLTNSTTLSAPVKQQLLGEAKFVRAFMYFYLTNLYGDVPLATTTNYQVDNVLSRTPQALVYQQIIADLISAQSLLSDSYLDPSNAVTSERVRPNKGAATALLARVYLYTNDWKDAETQASAVINNTTNYTLVNNLNGVFLANSTEAIWQLQSTIPNVNTQDAITYILTAGPNNANHPVALSPSLVKAFESGDQRMAEWVGINTFNGTTYYYAYKYKVGFGQPVTEYEMLMRLAEQYLIRAETEANGAGGGTNSAVQDLNIIRNRAGLANYSGATDKASLVTAILHERQVELFTELGHRWLDLKRTATVNAVMSVVTPQKGGTWDANWQLYPIPRTEIQVNPNLKQNPGY